MWFVYAFSACLSLILLDVFFLSVFGDLGLEFVGCCECGLLFFFVVTCFSSVGVWVFIDL